MTNSPQVETLNQILTDVVANRKNLASQLETQQQQIEVGTAQLAKFDTLIATLQVALDTPASMEAILQQEAANAVVSPTDAAAASNDAAAGASA
jgi:hypothetical protein